MYVCLFFIHNYTIHPIAIKLWEAVEYIPAKVSDLVKLLNSTLKGKEGVETCILHSLLHWHNWRQ